MNGMSSDQNLKSARGVNTGLLVVSAVTALILLVPLVAMQFTDEVAWTAGDFAVAAVLLVGTGSAYVFAARKLTRKIHRAVVGAALALALLLLWAELAVGIVGDLPFSGS